MRIPVLALALALALPNAVPAQTPAIADAEVRKGIAQVDEGEYDNAILTLDSAARRLAAEKGHSSRDLAEAYFYLGVAYLGKGHETSAKARFREAVNQARDMSPSPEKFPPRVIELFEKAREESSAAGTTPAAAPAASAPPAPKKGGGNKALLIVGGLALVGGGVAVAAGGGGDGGSAAETPSSTPPQTFNASGSVGDQGQQGYTFTAARAGTMEATVTWQDRNIELRMACQENDPPYTQCPGTYNRVNDTSARFTSSVSQKTYLLLVENFSGRAGAEPFTITIRYP